MKEILNLLAVSEIKNVIFPLQVMDPLNLGEEFLL